MVLVARRAEVFERFANELRSVFPIEAVVLPADLSRPDAVDLIVARTGHLDVGLLVAAAGFGTSGHFVDSEFENELDMIDVKWGRRRTIRNPVLHL